MILVLAEDQIALSAPKPPPFTKFSGRDQAVNVIARERTLRNDISSRQDRPAFHVLLTQLLIKQIVKIIVYDRLDALDVALGSRQGYDRVEQVRAGQQRAPVSEDRAIRL